MQTDGTRKKLPELSNQDSEKQTQQVLTHKWIFYTVLKDCTELNVERVPMHTAPTKKSSMCDQLFKSMVMFSLISTIQIYYSRNKIS